MCGKYFRIKVPTAAIIFGLIVMQMICTTVKAKHYNLPYGDILEENEDAHTEGNQFEHRHGQQVGSNNQQIAGRIGRHEKQFVRPESGPRKSERERSPYRNLESNYNNRNNRNLERNNNNNGWLISSSFVEEEHENITEEVSEDPVDHKCNIWVPMDALDKYPDAEKKQNNKIAGSVYIEICCKGYAAMRWRGRTLCRPVCDNCQNGRCIEPGVCECYDEYVANDNGDCVFSCPIGCLNGRCYLDGSCECDPGYKLDASRKFCRPICSKGCGTSRLHNCTEPEVCGCIKGYTLTDDDCQPVCKHDCGIGGICRQPDTCECNPGYDLKDGVCQADCYQKCDNGICFSRNRCICNPGYTYHERSTQCIPK